MNISKRKVVSLTDSEVELINRVVNLLHDLEDELEGKYNYSKLINKLVYIQYKEHIIEDESHD